MFNSDTARLSRFTDCCKVMVRIVWAYFVDNKNIGDIETLVAIVDSLGLNGTAAREALETRAFSDKVDEDLARSRASGVTGVPTFTAQGLAVVGCQPYETLEKFVQHLLEHPKG